jgi:4-diphosphocytidyl-2-C-methyl-D-erythritol kinase
MSHGSNPFIHTHAAQAKINLGLAVTSRRPDGYHELSMINARLALADEITYVLSGNEKKNLHVDVTFKKFECELRTAMSASYIPSSTRLPIENNIIVKAISEFELGFLNKITNPMHLAVQLKKYIPIGGGLGGGSTDAASALLFLYLTTLGMGQELEPVALDPLLHKIALSIGADVPFFLHGYPLAKVSGIGEVVEPMTLDDIALGTDVSILVPPFSLSTAAVFEVFAYNKLPFSPTGVPALYQNDLIEAAAVIEPRIKELLDAIRIICPRSGLSGTGSSLFSIAPTEEERLRLRRFAEQENLAIIETNIA